MSVLSGIVSLYCLDMIYCFGLLTSAKPLKIIVQKGLKLFVPNITLTSVFSLPVVFLMVVSSNLSASMLTILFLS